MRRVGVLENPSQINDFAPPPPIVDEEFENYPARSRRKFSEKRGYPSRHNRENVPSHTSQGDGVLI